MKYQFILPAYKRTYLKKALESILSQTYKNFEVIVIDDASPEDLKSICDEFTDIRLHYYRNKVNIGRDNLCHMWKHCLKYACSEYLILASDDDMFEPEFLQLTDKYTQIYPTANILRCNTRIISGEGKVEKEDFTFTTALFTLTEYMDTYFPQQVRCIANTLYKTNWIKKHGFCEYDLAWHSDNMTAFMAAKDNGIVLIGEKILFNFRVSGINISSTNNTPSILRKAAASSQYFSDLDILIKDLPANWIKRKTIKFKYMRGARLLFFSYAYNVAPTYLTTIFKSIYANKLFEWWTPFSILYKLLICILKSYKKSKP
ncbi:MAG: glycosyltransferase family 2 protein [Bacteroides eggerthii]|jgi:glycosyltransferase involved in cell wall biosynthesis|uniref:glycosyltransferase family 2 protein n=1 Tax=Bacteroides eggerthii TaxID=28111 RepID=UPI00189753EE|nr:glycosyltransferase family 2 protein [Bacteroides eggerthii]